MRKWEQAFRIYAVIYTEHNPLRATEIWQYMHVINVAASSYQWENIASYELTFRQLMAYKPQRSWAKLYHQGWNLAMRDPVHKGSYNNKPNHEKRDWRDDCCWKYNRTNVARKTVNLIIDVLIVEAGITATTIVVSVWVKMATTINQVDQMVKNMEVHVKATNYKNCKFQI